MRLLALTGVLVTALVGAGSAHANHGLTPTPTTPVLQEVAGTWQVTDDAWNNGMMGGVNPRNYNPPVPGWSPSAGSSTVPAVINKAQRRSRILPALRTAGAIGGALSIGWAIGELGGDTVYRIISGGSEMDATPQPNLIDLRWVAVNSSISNWADPGRLCWTEPGTETFDCSTFNLGSGDGGEWVLAGFTSAAADSGQRWDCRTSLGVPNSSCGSTVEEMGLLRDSAISNGLTGYTVAQRTKPSGGFTPCSSGLGVGAICRIYARTDEQMDEAREVSVTDQTTYDALPAGAKLSSTYATPGDLGTTADKQAAATALISDDGSQTDAQMRAEEAIACDIDPVWCDEAIVTPEVMTLLQPLVNETYAEYVARLEAAGWLGTATTTVLSSELAGYGPEAVARVIVQGSPNAVYDPLAWPSTAVEIAIDADITVRYNPSTAAPAPTNTSPPATTVTGAPTTIPSPPAVDFGPITALDPGCKFPYGFICYAVDFTEQFSVTADAPRFEFTLGWTGTVNGQAEGAEAPYIVDLEVMDDYMALWRGILTVVLWVGAIYLVATRMLGFKSGGDPGEAIDDVL